MKWMMSASGKNRERPVCPGFLPVFFRFSSVSGRATGILFVTDPIEDSFARGALNIAGLEEVSFDECVEGPPIRVNLRGMTFVDALARELRGSVENTDSDGGARAAK